MEFLVMIFGPKITKVQLKKATHINVLRLARFLRLKKELDIMSKNCLESLILWKLRKDDPLNEKSSWR
jgi:hypothetical protein